MAPLIDLPTYKAMIGVAPTDTRYDTQINALLNASSEAVRSYTGRSFELAGALPSERTFQYDGSGYLDIDDCVGITNVQVNVPNVTDPLVIPDIGYTAMPDDDSPVFYYLILHGVGSYYGFSPQMGFTRNLDQYPATAFKPSTIGVTATWGWTQVPEDVQLATALTIQGFVSSGGNTSEGLTSEAIEGWSRSWGNRGISAPMLAIPNRARDLLATYQRIYV
jgi:hypothetical protein